MWQPNKISYLQISIKRRNSIYIWWKIFIEFLRMHVYKTRMIGSSGFKLKLRQAHRTWAWMTRIVSLRTWWSHFWIHKQLGSDHQDSRWPYLRRTWSHRCYNHQRSRSIVPMEPPRKEASTWLLLLAISHL